MPDTWRALRTRWVVAALRAADRGAPLALASLAALLASTTARAETTAVRAQVAWVRAERVYLVADDSLSLEVGDRVTFIQRGKPVAAGVVARTLDREMAAVTLSSGSLAKVRDRDRRRLRIESERPAPVPPPSLRIGVPGAGRTEAFLDCERVAFLPPLPASAYAILEQSERGARLARDPAQSLTAPWPDTLRVRFFDDAADQEIALERGEIDVAVFWPGEPSRHLREHPRWRGHLIGIRSRAARDSPRPDADTLASLRCPVVCEPRLLPYLRALGADALVAAIDCVPAARKP